MLPRSFFRSLLVTLAATTAVVGCAVNGEEVGSEASEVVVQAQVLGNIGNGDTKTGTYSGAPANRAFAFRATGNDTITIDVGMVGGDAVAMLTDANLNVIRESDGGGPGNDARVTFTVPEGPSRKLHVAFRNNSGPNGNFKVQLGIRAGQCTGSEPWFDYHAKAEDCDGLSISCGGGQIQFQNACGCGCERPQ